MAAEAIADPLFLDTSLIVAATVEAHPAHKAASNFVDARVSKIGSMDRAWIGQTDPVIAIARDSR